MQNINQGYGNFNLNDRSIEIDKIPLGEMPEYLTQLQNKESAVVDLQNELLMRMINM